MSSARIAVVVAVLVAAVAARSDTAPARPASVLALTYVSGSGWSLLSRVDPVTLARQREPVSVGGSVRSWSFSPSGQELAVAFGLGLSFADVGSLQVRRGPRLADRGEGAWAVTWPRPNRLLALVQVPEGVLVVSVDPETQRVLRRTLLQRTYGFAFGRLRDGLAFLLSAQGRFAPAQVAVVDADGAVRRATIRKALAGSVVTRKGREPRLRERTVGFAVDPAARRAYVVTREFAIAEVDLDSLSVRYRTAPTRTLARTRRTEKWIQGSNRFAAWLGGGVLVAGGVDWPVTSKRPKPKPLPIRLVDVRAWSSRLLDAAGGFDVGSGTVLVRSGGDLRGFGADGRERYRVPLAPATWLVPAGELGYACSNLDLTAVLDLGTGASLPRPASPAATPCPLVLAETGSRA